MGFTYLYGALQTTDLVTDLNTSFAITVFIPTNQAFIDVGSAINDLDQSSISSMLRIHVVLDVYYTTNLSDGDSLKTLAQESYTPDLSVTVDESDGALFVSNARVITPNILLRNGVAHLVDQVLNVEEDDETYGYEYSLDDGDGLGVPGFEDAASATFAALTSEVPSPRSAFTPTATFSVVSGAVERVTANPATFVGMLYAVLMAAA